MTYIPIRDIAFCCFPKVFRSVFIIYRGMYRACAHSFAFVGSPVFNFQYILSFRIKRDLNKANRTCIQHKNKSAIGIPLFEVLLIRCNSPNSCTESHFDISRKLTGARMQYRYIIGHLVLSSNDRASKGGAIKSTEKLYGSTKSGQK